MKRLRPEHSLLMTGAGNPMFGRKHSELTRRKIGEALRSNPSTRAPKSARHRHRIAIALRGKSKTEAHRAALVRAAQRPGFGNRGRKFTARHRRRISSALRGRRFSLSHREALCRAFALEGNPNWKGGLSRYPYPVSFNRKLKKMVKEFYDNTCQLCWRVVRKGMQRRLTVHHIDYDKQNIEFANLIALCNSCNSRVNGDRIHWKKHFERQKLSEPGKEVKR